MSQFVELLEVHQDLLRLRGYDEASLNAPEKPGFFLKQFERQLSLAIRDGQRHGEPIEFDVKAVGFFNEDADVILFTFNYQYDPHKDNLALQRLDAKMNGEVASFPLKASKDLPLAAAVHRSFTSDKKLEWAQHIAQHTVERAGKRFLKI